MPSRDMSERFSTPGQLAGDEELQLHVRDRTSVNLYCFAER